MLWGWLRTQGPRGAFKSNGRRECCVEFQLPGALDPRVIDSFCDFHMELCALHHSRHPRSGLSQENQEETPRSLWRCSGVAGGSRKAEWGAGRSQCWGPLVHRPTNTLPYLKVAHERFLLQKTQTKQKERLQGFFQHPNPLSRPRGNRCTGSLQPFFGSMFALFC